MKVEMATDGETHAGNDAANRIASDSVDELMREIRCTPHNAGALLLTATISGMTVMPDGDTRRLAALLRAMAAYAEARNDREARAAADRVAAESHNYIMATMPRDLKAKVQ